MTAFLSRYGRFVTLPASFLVNFVLSHYYGTESIGQYVYFMSIINLASLVAIFGTGQSMWAETITRSPDDSLRSNSTITIAVSVFVSAGLLLMWNSSFFPTTWRKTTIVICIFAVFGSAINICIKNYHLLRGRMDISYANDIILYTSLIAGFSATRYLGDENPPMVFLIAVYATCILFSGPYFRIGLFTGIRGINAAYLRSSAISMLGGLMGLLSYRIVYLVLGRLFDDASLGYFALVATTCDACTLLISSLMIGDLHKIKNKQQGILRPLLIKQITLSCLASFAIILVGPEVISIVYNVNILQIKGFTLPLGLSITFLVLYKYTQNILLLHNGAKAYLSSNCTFLGLQAIALLISHDTPLHVAWSGAIAQILITAYLLIRNHSRIGFSNETH